MSQSQAGRTDSAASNRPSATRHSRQASDGRNSRLTAGTCPPRQCSGVSADFAVSTVAPGSRPAAGRIGRPSRVAGPSALAA